MIAEILGVASIATSILGGVTQAQSASAGADIARQNAGISRLSAAASLQAGQVSASQIRYAAFKTKGQQRSAYAKAGLAQSGSLLDVMADTAVQYELDAQRAVYAGELRALGLEREASMQEYQGDVMRRSGMIGGITTALAGTIGGIGSVYKGRQEEALYQYLSTR